MESTEKNLLKKRLLTLLKDFDSICKGNNINYTLHGGSLLGAIRHGGFIPWDDDIDIAMTHCEYMKLCRVLESSDEFYINTKLVKMPKFMRQNSGDIELLDIFEYTYISEKILPQKIKILALLLVGALSKPIESLDIKTDSRHPVIRKITVNILSAIGSKLSHEVKLKWYKTISTKWCQGRHMYIHRSNDKADSVGIILPSECMKDYKYVDFEDTKMMISNGYDEILRTAYGDDYMTLPPAEKRQGHMNEVWEFNRQLRTKKK